MPLHIPEEMYGKRAENVPCAPKSFATSGSRAYGDAEIEGLRPKPRKEKMKPMPLPVMHLEVEESDPENKRKGFDVEVKSYEKDLA